MTETVQFLTVTFNRSKITTEQIRLFQKFVTDEHGHPASLWVVDNSTNITERIMIQTVCEKTGVRFFHAEVPHANPSMHHGLALNWAVKNVFPKMDARYFVLLDHDIFPMRKFCVSPKLMANNVYGLMQTNGGNLYIWPGFFFADRTLLPDSALDFRPVAGQYDTGGGIFKGRVKPNPACGATEEIVKIGCGSDPQNDTYSIIDGRWLHWRNPQGTWKPGEMSKKDEVLWAKAGAM